MESQICPRPRVVPEPRTLGGRTMKVGRGDGKEMAANAPSEVSEEV